VRICCEPSEEDRQWFPNLAGSGDWRAALKDAWANFRDESFIRQYLSPRLIRELKLFAVVDDEDSTDLLVTDIHDERGYTHIREALADSYDIGAIQPEIQVVDADLKGQRHLRLQHRMRNGMPLDPRQRQGVVDHIQRLWGYEVTLTGVTDSDATAYQVRAGGG